MRDAPRDRCGNPAGGGRARSAGRAQGAAAGQGAALGRARADPQPRHHRRIDRQWRPGGRDSACGGNARCDAGGRRPPPETSELAAPEILSRADDHGAARGRCILTCVRFPVWAEGRIGTGFHEVAARRSDFALVAAAAQVALDADGRCTRACARDRRRLRHPGSPRCAPMR